MTPLVALGGLWLVGVFLLALDGRKAWVTGLAGVALGIVAAAHIGWLVISGVGGEPLRLTTGDWPAGVGISLALTPLSVAFAALCAVVLAAVMLHETLAKVRSRLFPALLVLLASGLHGAFFTRDLFNFYVFFELCMVASFALAAYGFGRAEIRGSFVYIALNLLGSVIFLLGVTITYHLTGTLDFEQIARRAGRGATDDLLLPAALLFVALSLKLGLFPFHGWVPLLYSHARAGVAAALTGALTNIGAYGLLRLGYSVAPAARREADLLLLTVGALGALYGALLALGRRRPGEVAAYLSVVHAGYLVLALGLGGAYGALALVLTVLSGSLDKAIMFLALDAAGWARAVAGFIAAISLSGLPISAGFLSKVLLFRAGLEAPASGAVTAALLLSATLVLAAAFRFWSLITQPDQEPSTSHTAGTAAIGLAALVLGIGLFGEPVYSVGWELSQKLVGQP